MAGLLGFSIYDDKLTTRPPPNQDMTYFTRGFANNPCTNKEKTPFKMPFFEVDSFSGKEYVCTWDMNDVVYAVCGELSFDKIDSLSMLNY